MSRINPLLRKHSRFVKYSIIGVTGATLDFLLFALFVKVFGVYYLFANVISVTAGITNNFFLNAFFNFRKKDRLLNRFVKFYSVGLFGLLLSSALLYIAVEVLFISEIISKIIIIGVIVIVQYTLNKKFTFK
jgi:putative flippase GtrA